MPGFSKQRLALNIARDLLNVVSPNELYARQKTLNLSLTRAQFDEAFATLKTDVKPTLSKKKPLIKAESHVQQPTKTLNPLSDQEMRSVLRDFLKTLQGPGFNDVPHDSELVERLAIALLNETHRPDNFYEYPHNEHDRRNARQRAIETLRFMVSEESI